MSLSVPTRPACWATLMPFSSLPHALGEEVVEVVMELDFENPMIDIADCMLSNLSYSTMRIVKMRVVTCVVQMMLNVLSITQLKSASAQTTTKKTAYRREKIDECRCSAMHRASNQTRIKYCDRNQSQII